MTADLKSEQVIHKKKKESAQATSKIAGGVSLTSIGLGIGTRMMIRMGIAMVPAALVSMPAVLPFAVAGAAGAAVGMYRRNAVGN